MASLFGGTPQQAPSYVQTTTETPKWMQDAIYNQINWSQNIAQRPFEPYAGALVAGAQPQQTAAWNQVTQAQGQYAPFIQSSLRGTENIAQAQGGEYAAAPYYQRALASSPSAAAQGALANQASMLGGINYGEPVSTLSPFIQSASAGVAGAAAPVTQSVASYLNPYNEAVTNRIAQLGARNLQENLLPALSSSFIKAGQFGSRGMGEFGRRALRDVGESVLGQQAQALQQGYGQAMSAAQADAARQLQAAQQIGALGGQLTSAQQQAIAQGLAGAAQYGQLGQTVGGLAGQQQQAMLTAAQQAAGIRATDLARQQSALAQLASQAQTAQQMGYTDIAALEAAGQTQQAQRQRELDAAYQQSLRAQQYPLEQLNFLSSQIRGLAPYTPTTQTQQGYTTTYGQSPLSQLATGLAAGLGLYKVASGG